MDEVDFEESVMLEFLPTPDRAKWIEAYSDIPLAEAVARVMSKEPDERVHSLLTINNSHRIVSLREIEALYNRPDFPRDGDVAAG